MSRLRHHRLLLALFALLAVGWAQMSGLHRGFMCDCGGVEQLTQVDHCHGPHSAICHDEDDHEPWHSHDDEDDGDQHEHAAVVDSLVAQQQESTPDVSVCLALIGTFDWNEYCRPTVDGDRRVKAPPPRRSQHEHEWPRRLAQVIALRI